MGEFEVLVEQLDEVLAEGAEDAEDALEIATLAGLAARLGGSHGALDEAEVWRDEGGGQDLLDEAFEDADELTDKALANLDGVLSGEASEEDVEEALYELDDLVAAAVWSGHRAAVVAAARQAAGTIRQVPEPFAAFAVEGAQMARLPTVAADLELYEYWLAVADAGAYKDER